MKAMQVVCLLLAASLFSCCHGASEDVTLGLGFGSEALNQLVNALILPVVSDAVTAGGAKLPENCCYKNVELARTDLYLENLVLPASSVVTTGNVQTTSLGPFIVIDTQWDLQFHYKLCIESVEGHCTTLFFCRGDATLHFDTRMSFILDVRASSTNEPVVTLNDFDFHLAIPSKAGLCEFLSAGIDVLVPLINEAANLKVAALVNNAIAGFTSNLNQTIDGPLPTFAFQWGVSNQTASSVVGSSLMLILDVLVASSGYKPGPFTTAAAPLPNALTLLSQDDQVVFELHSAVINNIIYSFYSLKEWQKVIDTDGFKITATFLSCPTVHFEPSTNGNGASITISLKLAVKKFGVPFTTAKANATAFFELYVTPQGEIYAQLSDNDFVVDIYSTSPPLGQSTISSLENLVTNDYYNAVPGINADLAAATIQLPPIADFSNPQIIYGNEYVVFDFAAGPANVAAEDIPKNVRDLTTTLTSLVADAVMSFDKPADTATSCPDLSGIGASQITCPDESVTLSEE
jgi:hypothetical protein